MPTDPGPNAPARPRLGGIVVELRARYERPVDDEVRDFLARMVAHRHVIVEEAT